MTSLIHAKVSDTDDGDDLVSELLSAITSGVGRLVDYTVRAEDATRRKLDVEFSHGAITNRIGELCRALEEAREVLAEASDRIEDLEAQLEAKEAADA